MKYLILFVIFIILLLLMAILPGVIAVVISAGLATYLLYNNKTVMAKIESASKSNGRATRSTKTTEV